MNVKSIAAVAWAFAALAAAAAPLKTGVFVDRGARGYGQAMWIRIATCMKDAEVAFVDGEDVRNGALESLDVLIMPGGRSVQEAESFGVKGREKLKDFIRGGGGYIGTCAGCCLLMQPCSHHPGMLGIIPYAFSHCGGSADMRIDFNERAQELAGIKKGAHTVHYEDGPVPVPTTNKVEGADIEVVARYASDVRQYGSKPRPSFAGNVAAVAGTYGKGRLFALSVHPECDASNLDIVRGAFKYTTGRDVEWEFPQRKRGQVALGFVCADSLGKESAGILAGLLRGGEYDVSFVDVQAASDGALLHLDAVLAPDNMGSWKSGAAGLTGANAARTRAFLASGGRVIAWGRAVAGLKEAKIDGFAEAADGKAALAELAKFAADGEAGPKRPDPPPQLSRQIRVALYCGPGGANYDVGPWMLRTGVFAPKVVEAKDIKAGRLKDFDLLLVPGGWSNAQFDELGKTGSAAIVDFVRGGGLYYGICAGAFLAAQPRIGLVPFVPDKPEHYRGGAPIYIGRTDAPEAKAAFGSWNYKTRTAYYHGGPAFLPGEPVEDSDVQVLAAYVGSIINTCSPKPVMSMAGKGAILGGRVGKGKVLLVGPHPEQREYSYDMVEDGLSWLTGVKIPRGTRLSRSRDALSVLFKRARNPEAARFFLEDLSPDTRFDAQLCIYSVDLDILPHADVVVLPAPKKSDATAEVDEFIRRGGTVVALANTPEKRKNAAAIPGATAAGSWDEVLEILGRLADGKGAGKGADGGAASSSRHKRGNLAVAVFGRNGKAAKTLAGRFRALEGIDATPVVDATIERGRLEYYDALVMPEGAKPGAGAASEIALFRANGGTVLACGKDGEDGVAKSLLRLAASPAPAAKAPAKLPGALMAVIYRDEGVSDDGVAKLLDRCPEIEIRYASGKDIANGALDGADMVVHGGGSGETQFLALGPEGVAAEREFVKRGGLYHGTCAGAFLVLEPTRRKRNQLVAFKPDDPPTYRGGARVRLDFTKEGAEAFGIDVPRFVGYHGGPAMLPGAPVEGSDCKIFANYGAEMTDVEMPKSDIKGLAGKGAIVGGTFGRGRILITGPHPEGDAVTHDIFYKGVEWLAGRKLTPARKWHRRGALRVCTITGNRSVEGGRLVRSLWNDPELNRILSPANCDALVLIDPKEKTYRKAAEFQGPVFVLAAHPESAKIAAKKKNHAPYLVFSTASDAAKAISALK